MRIQKLLVTLTAFVTLSVAWGCGDTPTNPPPPPPPPPVPSAAVEVTGNGTLVIHPSLDPAFCCTTEYPVRLAETGGGTAIWNFFRVSYFLDGGEIERAEQGADPIASAGFRDIAANSTNEANVFIRTNAIEFDDVRIVLGFADTKDGRAFERTLTLNAFSGVVLNPIPAALPPGQTFTIVDGAAN